MKLFGLLGGSSLGGAPAPAPSGVTVFARDTLTGLVSNDNDISGRALEIGGTWVNIATNVMNAVAGSPPYITGGLNATALYVASAVAGDLNQEAETRFLQTSYSSLSCGLILQSVGNITTGDRYDCFISGNSPYNLFINRYEAGVETTLATSATGAATFFPINTTKTMRMRLIDNGDGTVDIEVYVDDVLIVSGTDADPLATLGRAGIRGRNAHRFYNFVHRSVVIDGGGAPVDTTAPVLSNPIDAASGSTGAAISVDTNESGGTLYWVITGSATAPNVSQVKTGKDHAGADAAASGSAAVASVGTKSFSPTGLTAGQTYYAHFMQSDAAGNDSAVVSGNGFSTSGTLGIHGVAFSASSTTDATSYTPVLPAGNAGKTLVAFVASDGAPALVDADPDDEWKLIGQQPAISSAAKLFVFRLNRLAGASEPNPTFNSDGAQQFAAAVYAFTGPSLLNVEVAFGSGSSTTVDPPNLSVSAGPKECMLVTAVAKDNGVNFSVVPTGYSGADRATSGGSGTCTVIAASRGPVSITAENPSAWTVGDEQFAVVTAAVSVP